MHNDRIAKLIERLESKDDDDIDYAVQQLVKIGKPAVSALIDALKNGDVNEGTLRVLGNIADVSGAPALVNALKHENGVIRWNAAWALGKIGDKSTVPALIEALRDEDFIVQMHAAGALGRIADASAVPALIEAIRDKDRDVRAGAAEALGQIAEKCKTIEEVERIEKTIIEGSKALRKGRVDKTVLLNAQFHLAQVLKKIAETKNEFVPKRDLLLPDTIKAPKKGDAYNIMRKMRSG